MFKRYWWILLVMAPVGMIVGFLIASVVSYVMPKKYESFATIEVKPHGSTISDASPMMTPMYFSGTEFNAITSRNSLTKVAENLDLANRWGMDNDGVLHLLREIVKTENIRGTDLISITVRHTDREAARDITAEVAREYKDYRAELELKSVEKTMLELKKAVREQENKIEERRKVLTTISRNVLLDGSNLPTIDSQEHIDAKRDFETDQALLEQMKLSSIARELDTRGLNTVVVHDDPVIADAPVSPNVTLNLVLGAAGGLLISPFLALPLMWLLNRRNPAEG